jgi:hypothetical protein
MRLSKLLLAATLSVSAAAPALAAEFTADGYRYDYNAARDAKGAVLLTGHVQTTGQAFALHVNNRHVEGYVGSNPVSFDVSKSTVERLNAEMASTGGSAVAVAAN